MPANLHLSLVRYLTGLPASVRQTRLGDGPLIIGRPLDVMPLLPTRLPRFQAGKRRCDAIYIGLCADDPCVGAMYSLPDEMLACAKTDLEPHLLDLGGKQPCRIIRRAPRIEREPRP